MINSIRTNYSVGIVTLLLVGLGLAMSLPMFVSAATYAYVDVNGDVKSVVAPDWRTAINTASNIHIHSGVYLLSTGGTTSTTGTTGGTMYAYVDANGDVRSVTAPDWRIAINTAPNRHINSGVLLLSSANDFGVVGDNVSAF